MGGQFNALRKSSQNGRGGGQLPANSSWEIGCKMAVPKKTRRLNKSQGENLEAFRNNFPSPALNWKTEIYKFWINSFHPSEGGNFHKKRETQAFEILVTNNTEIQPKSWFTALTMRNVPFSTKQKAYTIAILKNLPTGKHIWKPKPLSNKRKRAVVFEIDAQNRTMTNWEAKHTASSQTKTFVKSYSFWQPLIIFVHPASMNDH